MRTGTRRRRWRTAAAGGAAAAGAVAVYRQLVDGGLTLDTGIGRRTAPLGPLTVDIDAPRDLVFDVIAAPYLGHAGAAGDHIEVLERGTDLVVAAHRTSTAGRVAVTVEAVSLDRPTHVGFRLLRGPVPHVVEAFDLEALDDDRTRLRYDGELGTDFWQIGAAWGQLVSRVWVRTVQSSLDDVRERAERRAAAHRRRDRGQ
jgi:hypothetical protein